MQPLLLTNATIVNEGRQFVADVLIEGKRIDKIFPEGHQGKVSNQNIQKIDLKGLHLLPGIIDDQVHFREPGLTHKATIHSESRAAVAGGITSFMEMPNTIPQTTSIEALEEKFRMASENSLANHSFYMGATNNNIDQLRALDIERTCGIKVFMGSSTGNMLVDNKETLASIFREARIPVAVHCEDEATIQGRFNAAKSVYGDDIPIHMHPVIRNHWACETSSRLALQLAEQFETRLHLLHLSTAGEVRLLRNDLPLKDKRITAEVCVHHLWFSMDDYAKKGSLIKWNPAVKYETDRLALIDAVKEGFLDVIATDHAPHTLEEKQNNYANCPSGAPMVQHALPAMITLALKHHISLEKVVELMCHNPAICFGINGRGFIREGYFADLVAVDLQKSETVSNQSIHYKCGWSPMEGSRFNASVAYTFVGGQVVYNHGKFDEKFRGEALQFSR